MEIWAPLICGGTLYLPHEETRLQPDALLAFFARHRLTHAFVPTVLVPEVIGAAARRAGAEIPVHRR